MSTVRIGSRSATRPSRRPVQRQRESSEEQLAGLCTTCNHAKGCAFRRDPTRPVVYCDEFDSYVAPEVEEQATRSESAPTAADLNEWDQYKGLCVNCENRQDCAIRNKEIGVWHCEEYT